MPWTVGDVDKHNSGLSDKAKEVWVRVANAALEKCQKDGGSNCDASAIKQANAVVAKNMSFEDWVSMSRLQTFNINGIEIFSTGKWNGDIYTEKDLDEIIQAFGKVGFEPPLKLGHNSQQEKDLMRDGQPALGWVGRIYREGKKLLADFTDIPQKLYDAMKRGNYRRVSSEIYWNYSSNGQSFPRVLKAVALLGADIPAVTNLDAITGLYKDETAGYKIYEEKEEENTMTPEEIKDLQDKAAKADTLTVEKTALEMKNKELTDQHNQAVAKLSEKEAEVKRVKVREFIAQQKQLGKLIPAIEKETEALLMGASEEKAYSYSSDSCPKCAGTGKIDGGALCPDCGGKGKVAAHAVNLSQRELVEKIFTKLPKIIEFGERGGNNGDAFTGDYDNAGAEVDKRAKYLIKEGKHKDYSEAVKDVLANDEELKKAYIGGK